jgi:acetyl-CoA decarbonylase/synthase complex subunit delta
VWKARETRLTKDEDPKLGDERKRSVLMEAIASMTLLIAGADVLIMRHPDSIALIDEMIATLTT